MRPTIHLLSGVAIAGLLPEKHRRPATVAFSAAAACLPDVDVVATLWGYDALAAVHRVMTHSAAGILVTSLAAAVFVGLFWKRQRFWPAFALVLVAQVTHVLLDACNGSVGVLWPLSPHWVSIADWPAAPLLLYAAFAALLPALYWREIRRGMRVLGFRTADRAGEARG